MKVEKVVQATENTTVIIEDTQTTQTLDPKTQKVETVTQKVLAKIKDNTLEVTKTTLKRKRTDDVEDVPTAKVAKKEESPLSEGVKTEMLKLFQEWSDDLYKTLTWLQVPLYKILKVTFEHQVHGCHHWDALVGILKKNYGKIVSHKDQLSLDGQNLVVGLEAKINTFIEAHSTIIAPKK